MSVSVERRKTPRVLFETSMGLWPIKKRNQGIYCDRTRDISLKSVYCYSNTIFPIGTHCDIELYVRENDSRLVLFIRGYIVRTDCEGMGVRFEEMDLESFLCLKRLLDYNLKGPKKIDVEFTCGDQNF